MNKVIVATTGLALLATSMISAPLSVEIAKKSEWNDGFCAEVTVYNPNDTAQLWEVSFNAQGIINNLWNASYTQDVNTLETTAKGLDWNKYVQPYSSRKFGYCAKKVQEAPATEGDLSVTEEVTANWGSGFCENVKVKNNSPYDVDWEITLAVNGSVYTHWNANLTQDSSTLEITASGVDWNNIVKANSEVEFGFCANATSSSSVESSSSSVESSSSSISSAVSSSVSSSSVSSSESSSESSISSSESSSVSSSSSSFSGEIAYKDVLPLALKFYEAQRAAGPFPTVTWRKPAALDDGQDVGRDLSKGWFDAGDHVKFNLPMSYSATMLNWAMLEFTTAFEVTNSLDYGKDQVKYALDYFLNAYDEGSDPNSPSDDVVYYQVGDPGADHAFWGPPELMTMERPTYSCNADNRCSEVSAGMAAALASGSILFRDDPLYSATLLDKAKKIYNFAETYQGNNGYTAANGYYTSFSGYNDELAWGAIWLYQATGDTTYLEKAKEYVQKAQDAIYWTHNWDNVSNGTLVLLTRYSTDSVFKDTIERNLNYWLHDITYTSGGLAFLNQWGSLRYASTQAFISLAYAKYLPEGNFKDELIDFAKSQIDYILGDNPRNSSYVVGYGNNYPINPHHRASHNSPNNSIDYPENNEFLLEGALVGGPKSADDFDYADDRHDYVANEVATDYNAGFTGALAGLVELFEVTK